MQELALALNCLCLGVVRESTPVPLLPQLTGMQFLLVPRYIMHSRGRIRKHGYKWQARGARRRIEAFSLAVHIECITVSCRLGSGKCCSGNSNSVIPLPGAAQQLCGSGFDC